MNHFEPKRAVLVYRPGSDKALHNLLKYSNIDIETVLLAEFDLPVGERKRFLDLNPSLTFTENLDEALGTDADTLLWTREILETKDDHRLWHEVIHAAVEKGKNIYNMAKLSRIEDDQLIKEAVAQSGVKYFNSSDYALPMGDIDIFGPYPDYDVKAKVLIFLGTSRRCGKFTTTKLVRSRLERRGIKVAELATEPYGLLAGAEHMIIPHVMPMWRAAPAVKNAVVHLDKTVSPDIIFVSSQSGFRITALDAPGRCGGVVAYAIAMGAVPDAAVLSTNFESLPSAADEIRHVELSIGRSVIGVSVKGPGHGAEEIERAVKELSSEINVPAFDPVANPDGAEGLVKKIVEMVG